MKGDKVYDKLPVVEIELLISMNKTIERVEFFYYNSIWLFPAGKQVPS